MAKLNIPFNNKNYSIDESSLSTASADLKKHLSTVMNGTGATIRFGGVAYNIDSTKLSAATNDFVTHLGTVSGDGYKVVVNGTEHNVASAKMTTAVSDLEVVLGGLISEGGDENVVAAGLYQTGSNYTVLLKSWDELLADGTVHVDNGAVYTNFNQSNFWNNSSSSVLSGDLALPSDGSATSIDDNAFLACKNITGIKLNDGIINIGFRAFYSCTSMTNIEIPNSVASIGETAFYGCSNLACIKIPSLVPAIGKNTFYNCNNLKTVIFDKNAQIDTIGIAAFYGCSNLECIEIPSSVTTIGRHVFSKCTSLPYISFAGTIEQWNAISKEAGWNYDAPATHVQCTDGTITL